ncbi:MAG TPA: hypothetical protein VIP11_21860 [Gemmatimonadaceae bacterium]
MPRRLRHRSFARARVRLALALLVAAACARNAQEMETDFDPLPGPIPIHVRNENFLDMNVAVVAGGVSRRLGQVSGNGSADFRINWSVANGQEVALVATPIGQNTRFTSERLSVRPGQSIDFQIRAVLRQSIAIVRE